MTNPTGRCALLNLGGTIGEIYDERGLARRSSASMLLAAAGLPGAWPACDVALIDSVEVSFATLELAAGVIAGDRTSDGFILCCGTDLLEEVAYAASLLLPQQRPIIVTAAAQSASDPGTDGPGNLRRAAALIAVGFTGTAVVMGDAIFAANGIVKIEPQGLQPFAAADGPIGRFRGELPCLVRSPIKEDRFVGLRGADCSARVAVLHEYLGRDDMFIEPQRLDGLVVAGAGAGGLSRRTYAMLEQHYLPVMPVVLSTRCPFGYAVDPSISKYALAKQRADGFLLDGYTHLSAVQARLRLILEIGLTNRNKTQ